jgi:hypothetical protein
MDRGIKIYAYILAGLMLALTFVVLYQPAKVRDLNAMLDSDPQLADYPYPFRVLRFESGTAEISSPRSSRMPVQHMIGAMYPKLGNRPVDDPQYLRAQQSVADHQARVKRLVLDDPEVSNIRWQLDETWLDRHGIQLAN